MSKVLIQSIQGTKITEVEGSLKEGYSNISYIKVTDLETGKELDWKLGVFTQGKGQVLTREEAEQLNKDYGFMYLNINPYKEDNDLTAISLLTKLGYIRDWDVDEYDNRYQEYFEGYIVIGEIELEQAKKLSQEYQKECYVY